MGTHRLHLSNLPSVQKLVFVTITLVFLDFVIL